MAISLTFVSLGSLIGVTIKTTRIFRINKEILGRVLGPAKNEVNEMAQWILKDTMVEVPC